MLDSSLILLVFFFRLLLCCMFGCLIIFTLNFHLVLCSPRHSRLTNQTRDLALLKHHKRLLAVVLRRSSCNYIWARKLIWSMTFISACIVLLLFYSCYLLGVNGRLDPSYVGKLITYLFIGASVSVSVLFSLFFFQEPDYTQCLLKPTTSFAYLVLQYIAKLHISEYFIHLMFLGLNWSNIYYYFFWWIIDQILWYLSYF